ncbi:hypothetical protein AC578_5551 [Pseudocercospora eumusae]|uniref:Uncharacterized protein n=1 Tax=Pseudocercospora eumusae TaxID=321146 RepID=A0A139H3B9_9PEZI|nr:hypothetical protein AC578_5551 [Pseudocercospora eumusae]
MYNTSDSDGAIGSKQSREKDSHEFAKHTAIAAMIVVMFVVLTSALGYAVMKWCRHRAAMKAARSEQEVYEFAQWLDAVFPERRTQA